MGCCCTIREWQVYIIATIATLGGIVRVATYSTFVAMGASLCEKMGVEQECTEEMVSKGRYVLAVGIAMGIVSFLTSLLLIFAVRRRSDKLMLPWLGTTVVVMVVDILYILLLFKKIKLIIYAVAFFVNGFFFIIVKIYHVQVSDDDETDGFKRKLSNSSDEETDVEFSSIVPRSKSKR